MSWHFVCPQISYKSSYKLSHQREAAVQNRYAVQNRQRHHVAVFYKVLANHYTKYRSISIYLPIWFISQWMSIQPVCHEQKEDVNDTAWLRSLPHVRSSPYLSVSLIYFISSSVIPRGCASNPTSRLNCFISPTGFVFYQYKQFFKLPDFCFTRGSTVQYSFA